MWVNTWINAIGEAGSTSNMFIGGYLQSPSSYSQYMINRYGDNDSDGIADVLETNGMINNIGHVVYLNPETAYTDEKAQLIIKENKAYSTKKTKVISQLHSTL